MVRLSHKIATKTFARHIVLGIFEEIQHPENYAQEMIVNANGYESISSPLQKRRRAGNMYRYFIETPNGVARLR